MGLRRDPISFSDKNRDAIRPKKPAQYCATMLSKFTAYRLQQVARLRTRKIMDRIAVNIDKLPGVSIHGKSPLPPLIPDFRAENRD